MTPCVCDRSRYENDEVISRGCSVEAVIWEFVKPLFC